MITMKALTLRHPWPFAVCRWGKPIENRGWLPPRSMIGKRFAIHGGKVPTSAADLQEIRLTFDILKSIHGEPEYRVDGNLTLRDILMPGIVATVVLDRFLSATDRSDPLWSSPWFDRDIPGIKGLVLRDLILLPKPIPCKGQQGFWDIPSDILFEIKEQGAL